MIGVLRVLVLGAALVSFGTLISIRTVAALPLVSDDAKVLTAADEWLLVSVINDVHEGHIDDALQSAERLVGANPNFRLAQLIYADLLSAKARVITDFGDAPHAERDTLSELLDEARKRVGHFLALPREGMAPAWLLELSADQRRVVVVDTDKSRLYLFENRNGVPVLAEDYYVSIGKNGVLKRREGDQKTPLGVYFVTSRLDARGLPDLYGYGAFPINYPNEWDARLGRTGFGIWLHGVPQHTYSRAPRASDGCMAIPNADIASLWDTLDIGTTPIVITDDIRWIHTRELLERRDAFRSRFESWRQAWESRDQERYSGYYSRQFRDESKDYSAWVRHKKRVNSSKKFIRVGVSNLSALSYPGEEEMVVTTFEQDYRSSNFHSQSRKRQYWRLEGDGVWRIVYEGEARFNNVHLRGIPYSARASFAAVVH